ncbi:hypothetical protein KUCAC02_025306, partial [Chaenocephalus aceratus]
ALLQLSSRYSIAVSPGFDQICKLGPEWVNTENKQEPHQRGLWLGGRGVGGGLALLRSFLPPPQGARHSVYQWQAKPDDEAACTANAVFEQGRGLPRHAEHTQADRTTCTDTHTHTYLHTQYSIRPTPGEFNTCSEDAAEEVGSTSVFGNAGMFPGGDRGDRPGASGGVPSVCSPTVPEPCGPACLAPANVTDLQQPSTPPSHTS